MQVRTLVWRIHLASAAGAVEFCRHRRFPAGCVEFEFLGRFCTNTRLIHSLGARPDPRAGGWTLAGRTFIPQELRARPRALLSAAGGVATSSAGASTARNTTPVSATSSKPSTAVIIGAALLGGNLPSIHHRSPPRTRPAQSQLAQRRPAPRSVFGRSLPPADRHAPSFLPLSPQGCASGCRFSQSSPAGSCGSLSSSP